MHSLFQIKTEEQFEFRAKSEIEQKIFIET